MRCPQCFQLFPTGTVLCPNDNIPLTVENLANTTPSSETLIIPERTLAGTSFGPGTKFGEYTIEEKVGEGGMGQVWKGRHPQIGKRVAIKILSEKLSRDHKTLARFMNEAKAVNEIQHRNIVDIFSFGELPDGRPYFVMELLRGKPLSEYIKEQGPLPLSSILLIIEQTCRALQAAHDGGIVHRDLKPDNIFLVIEEGAPLFVKLLDFGIAKLAGEVGPDGHRLTATGTVMGTASYMSPEQAEGKEIDPRADIYALGIILFEMLTGRTPFYEPGDGVGSIISKHIYLPAPPPSSMVSGRDISPALDAFVLHLLAKSPSDRPERCSQIYTDLCKAIGEQKTEESTPNAKPFFGKAPTAAYISDQIIKQTPQPSPPRDTGISHEIVPKPKKNTAFVLVAALSLVGFSLAYLAVNGTKRENTKRNTGQPELTKEQVTEKLVANQANFQACYERAAQKNPELPAQTSIRVEITPAGEVVTAKPIASISPGVDNCISLLLVELTFGANRRGLKDTFSLSFTPVATGAPASTPAVAPVNVVLIVACELVGTKISVDGVEKGEIVADRPFRVELPKSLEQEVQFIATKEGFEPVMKSVTPVADKEIDLCPTKAIATKKNPATGREDTPPKTGFNEDAAPGVKLKTP
jgi:serine/threonine protein kinase